MARNASVLGPEASSREVTGRVQRLDDEVGLGRTDRYAPASPLSLYSVSRPVRSAMIWMDERVVVAAGAAVVSLVAWYAFMASAPRYSHAPHQDLGNAALLPVLVVAATIGGIFIPRHATLIGVMLVAPALLLAPWTAPRGDNDGLWLLIVPILALFMGVTVFAARAGAWCRMQAIQRWR